MYQNDLSFLTDMNGFISACIFETHSGIPLIAIGDGVDFDSIGEAMSEVMLAHDSVPDYYGRDCTPTEEIVFNLGKQVHMLRPLTGDATYFAHLVLDRSVTSLGHARIELSKVVLNEAVAA